MDISGALIVIQERRAADGLDAYIPVILREEGSGTRDIFEGWDAKCGFDINVAMELNNPEGIKHAVMANLGLALVSKNVIKTELEDKRLVALTVTGLNTIRDIYLVHNRKRRFMPLMEKFQEFLLLKREVDKP